MSKRWQDKDWLYDQYWNQKKTQKEIASQCEIKQSSLNYWFKKLGIKTRSTQEAMNLYLKNKLYRNKDWLYNQYIILQKSLNEISEEFNFNRGTLSKWMYKFKIPIRNCSEVQIIAIKKGRSYLGKREKHPNWNNIQEEATTNVIHFYIKKRKKKPTLCENCKKKKRLTLSFDHSLNEYTRNPKDYKWLCYRCHKLRDWHDFGILNNQFTIKQEIING